MIPGIMAAGAAVDSGPDPDAVAVLAAMYHYWDLDESDNGSTTTTRTDDPGSWDFTERKLTKVVTDTGLRGGANIGAKMVNGGGASNANNGFLVHIGRTVSISNSQSFTVAGWVKVAIGTFPLTVFRESANTLTANTITMWIGIDNAGTSGSPYNVFALTTGANSSDYTKVAGTEAAVDGQWIFVQAVRDHANNRVGIRINGGSWTYTATTVLNYVSGADISLGTSLSGGTEVDRHAATFNYWGYYDGVLSDDELDYLYNVGSGKTYAEIVADAA